MAIEKNPYQIKFFEKLKQNIPANVSMANDIADVLEISADGSYRRMRGETVLSMDEMVKLCRHYNISSDFIASTDETSARFSFRKIIQNEDGFEEYLKNILNDLQKINASNPKQIIYAACDPPIFHQFNSSDYAAFKMFFWQKALLNIPSFDGQKFSKKEIRPELLELCKKIAETYIQIPSIEIWHEDTIHGNLKLIEYAFDSGFFHSKEDALHICTEYSDILSLIEKQAAKSSKFAKEEKWAENEGNYTLYQSELIISNNHVFITAGNARMIYLSHNTFNTMVTTNTVFCNESEAWMKNIIRKSVQISGVAEKQRHTFFSTLRAQVASLSTKISSS